MKRHSTLQHVTSLRTLGELKLLYTVPRDDLIGEVLVPAMAGSSAVRCMAGFFSSAAFRHVAPGLAAFINGSSGTFQLLISPVLNDEDQRAVREALERPEAVLARAARLLLEDALLSQSALQTHTLECLSYLLAARRLELRFVLMSEGGMFHPKVWIFTDTTDLVVAHGSSNPTVAGLIFNYETVSVERAWAGGEASQRAYRLVELFNALWTGKDPNALTIDLPEGLLLAEHSNRQPPTIDDFWMAWHTDAEAGLVPALPPGSTYRSPSPQLVATQQLAIPSGLAFQEGPFAHQGRAVRAWEEAGGRGLLAMATGSGKTVTALICATRLQKQARPLLVVVAAPYRPLIDQWRQGVAEFGVTPVRIKGLSGVDRDRAVIAAIRNLEYGVSEVEVAVVTHDYLVSDAFRRIVNDIPENVHALLIADEVHNLGRPRFVEHPPEQFEYRMGLSATPVLQYNEVGTAALTDFFGETVFEFGLADAIGVCLVPYNYYLHPVELGGDELEQWDDLTEKLLRAGFLAHDDGTAEGSLSPEVLSLLVRRRAVLETAAAKVPVLLQLLVAQGIDSVRHTLIYCSDKRPEQLLEVNRELLDAGFFMRQLTAAETADREKTQQILDDFAGGQYQILTCKRVLDEGVDMPQVRQAFLLASSTVRRQWIQRRGRILRRCDPIGKTLAYLHDFLVVPPDLGSASGRAILRQELERGRAFAELAANSGSRDGPFAVMADVAPAND
jgi:superfamily II DNA or RNA helicase